MCCEISLMGLAQKGIRLSVRESGLMMIAQQLLVLGCRNETARSPSKRTAEIVIQLFNDQAFSRPFHGLRLRFALHLPALKVLGYSHSSAPAD